MRALTLTLILSAATVFAQSDKSVTTFFNVSGHGANLKFDPVIVKTKTLATFGAKNPLFSLELDGFAGINAGQGSAGIAGCALMKKFGDTVLGFGVTQQIEGRLGFGVLAGFQRSY